MVNFDNQKAEIRQILDSQIEWLLIARGGKSFALKSSEIELESAPQKLILGFIDDTGFQNWRIKDWKYENQKLIFQLARNFGKENVKIELVPRISAKNLAETSELSRIEKASEIAALLVSENPELKILRVELNKENGRFARIIAADRREHQTAVLAEIAEDLSPESLLSSAILWLEGLRRRKKNPIHEIWLSAASKNAKALQKLHVLLKESWREKIFIKEISLGELRKDGKNFRSLEKLEFENLWNGKKKNAKTSLTRQVSETAKRIIEISPSEIDVLKEKNGESLSFSGVKFARTRKILSEEIVWFGIENKKQRLSANNFAEFVRLLDELKLYRRHDSPNKNHIFYKTAPESWLESILRKNIKVLDANLILSPLYNQFRAERERIDLLALRRDGRLVIIEVKTAPDREMIFQAADYWRKIEKERRCGNLQAMKIFGDFQIKDEPALVYLVAPLLSFHKNFDFFAATISDKIEMYRFDLNENWREALKTIRREEILNG